MIRFGVKLLNPTVWKRELFRTHGGLASDVGDEVIVGLSSFAYIYTVLCKNLSWRLPLRHVMCTSTCAVLALAVLLCTRAYRVHRSRRSIRTAPSGTPLLINC
jgi:hypothetical protein